MRSLLPLVGLLSLATTSLAQTFVPKNWTDVDSVPSDQAIEVAIVSGHNTIPIAGVLPKTTDAGTDPPISGPGLLLTAKNELNIQEGQIILVSCDPGAWPGFETLNSALSAAEGLDVAAIIMYSSTSDTCDLTSDDNGFPDFYASKSAMDTATMLQRFKPTLQGSNTINVVIGPSDNSSNGTGSTDNSSLDNDANGPTPSTTVAMIVLYSITGVITTLFLAVIITGAVRAHRHPERYGPQAVFGHPRQSRARGLARAMLDSLPIVKVGDRSADASKLGDVELAAQNHVDENGERTHAEATDSIHQVGNTDRSEALPSSEANSSSETPPRESGIAAAAVTTASPSGSGDHTQGCSICTEDFVIGEDQRVLPCDHRFHPNCVDPWLLNVSGTCPLCRIDLNPPNDQTNPDEMEDGAEDSPTSGRNHTTVPPTAMTEEEMSREQQARGSRTFTNSVLLSIVGLSRPNPTSREEQRRAFEAYAAWQQQQREMGRQESPAPSEGDAENESRLRRTMRNVFRVRTRRTGTLSDITADEPVAESNADSAARATTASPKMATDPGHVTAQESDTILPAETSGPSTSTDASRRAAAPSTSHQ
ncbi:Hypothetical protein R9X50_00578600 [Acrodontium crateriforme]|uniref:RING-type domain-containing protein n=1 Tax=Acrodontium crateriforme TaxID=150365 RepID=A0AAQ3R693_9PEZI|nr:Hypothetical protein R9X50_00578600 [Acrodontium crateriforme]